MFHWICPECGREIPPSVRECQACDPVAAALAQVLPPAVDPLSLPPPDFAPSSISVPAIEPVLQAANTMELPRVAEFVREAAPAVEARLIESAAEYAKAVTPPPVPEQPVIEVKADEPTPIAAVVAAPFVEVRPVAEPAVEVKAAVEAAPVLADSVKAVDAPPVVEQPPVAEPAMGITKAEAGVIQAGVIQAGVIQAGVIQAGAIQAVQLPEPVPEAAKPVEPTRGVEPRPFFATPPVSEPVVEAVEATKPELTQAASMGEATRVVEPPPSAEPISAAAVLQPAVETAPTVAEPAVELHRAFAMPPVSEPVVEAAKVIEPVPALVSAPVVEAPQAVEGEPALETAKTVEPHTHAHQPDAPIKLHELPDPLLALAVEIRAVQAARAAALSAPPESTGLLGLAEAIGVSEQPVLPAPRADTEPLTPPLAAAPSAEPALESNVPAQAASEVKEQTVHAVAAVQQDVAEAEVPQALALAEPPAPEPVPVLSASVPPAHALEITQRFEIPVEAAVPAPPAPLIEAQPEPFMPAPEPDVHVEPAGPALPFAPMQYYTPATSSSIRPVPPRLQILAADSGPRITLPGPTLPPELTRLQDANVVTVLGEKTETRVKEVLPPAAKKTGGTPGWLVSLGVMLLLLAVGLSIVSYLLPHTVADAKPAPTRAEAATTAAPTVAQTSPLSKFIEVTGFRIVNATADSTKKSEVQYLVVNHSGADISDANIFITLRSAKAGQPPVCRFSFKVPSLAPFESKEMSSPIEKATHGVTLPDWQDLRADVQISQ